MYPISSTDPRRDAAGMRQIPQRFITAPTHDLAAMAAARTRRRDGQGGSALGGAPRAEPRRPESIRAPAGNPSGSAHRDLSSENQTRGASNSHSRTQPDVRAPKPSTVRPNSLEARMDENGRVREELRIAQKELANLRAYAEHEKAKDIGEIQDLKERLLKEHNQRKQDRQVLEEKIRILVTDNNRLKERTLTLERSLEEARTESVLEKSKRVAVEAASSISHVRPSQMDDSTFEMQKSKQLKAELEQREAALASAVLELERRQMDLERVKMLQHETQRRNEDLAREVQSLKVQLDREQEKVTLQRAYLIKKLNEDPLSTLSGA